MFIVGLIDLDHFMRVHYDFTSLLVQLCSYSYHFLLFVPILITFHPCTWLKFASDLLNAEHLGHRKHNVLPTKHTPTPLGSAGPMKYRATPRR